MRAAGSGHRLHVEHDVRGRDFLGWLHAADVVVDLRFPHRGEVSGSLARAMQLGRPTIVSATGTYLDAPDGSVLSVDAGPTDPGQLADRIRTLAEDEDLRRRIGADGPRPHGTARRHRGHGARVRRGDRRDARGPRGRRPPTSWSGGRRALFELGVTQEHLDAGYGLAYARALESFKRSPSSAPGADEAPC